MISTENFWKVLRENGYFYFSGVPCSILANILNYAIRDPSIIYIPAVRENSALGIASGAYLAGRKSGILIQNSGLGNIINALTSFNLIYKIPVLMFISWRGLRENDAPEHLIMGTKTLSFLKESEIPAVILTENYREEIIDAIKLMETELSPVAMVIKPDTVQ